MINRIRRSLRVSSDRGTLMNALVFMLIGTAAAGLMVGFFLQRSSADYAAAQQAKVKSAIAKLSGNVLGRINDDFPTAWTTMSTDELAAETAPLGEDKAVGANAHLAYFSVNKDSGVLTAEIQGQSTAAGHVAVTATIRLVPTGAGVFKGLDRHGRPEWIYSDSDLDALALWELAPNGVRYINGDGTYQAQKPELAPEVSIEQSDTGGTGVIGNVYCRAGGTVEYRAAWSINGDAFTAWSPWSTTQQRIGIPVDEGSQISFRAQARCKTDVGISDPSPNSADAVWTRPIAKVEAAPTVTLTGDGEASWTAISCPATAHGEYHFQYAINEDASVAYSDWATSRTTKLDVPEGGQAEIRVQAKCRNDYTDGAPTPVGYATAIRDVTQVADDPTAELDQDGTVRLGATGCLAPTTSQVRYRTSNNSDDITAAEWSDWFAPGDGDGSADTGEGQRIKVQVDARCATAYQHGPSSEDRNRLVTKTLDVPVTTTPVQPTVEVLDDFSRFRWAEVECSDTTTPRYTWDWAINDGALTKQTTWVDNPGAVVVPFHQGDTLTVHIAARCHGFTGDGPSSGQATFAELRPVTDTPSAPAITIAPDSSATWTGSGCPIGTQIEYQWRTAIDGGAWSAFTGWSSTTAAAAQIQPDQTVSYGVSARCANPDTAETGPQNYSQTGWFTRAIPTPEPITTVSQVDDDTKFYPIEWTPAACAAGTAEYRVDFSQTAPENPFAVTSTTFDTHAEQAEDTDDYGYIFYGISARCVGANTTTDWSTPTQLRWNAAGTAPADPATSEFTTTLTTGSNTSLGYDDVSVSAGYGYVDEGTGGPGHAIAAPISDGLVAIQAGETPFVGPGASMVTRRITSMKVLDGQGVDVTAEMTLSTELSSVDMYFLDGESRPSIVSLTTRGTQQGVITGSQLEGGSIRFTTDVGDDWTIPLSTWTGSV